MLKKCILIASLVLAASAITALRLAAQDAHATTTQSKAEDHVSAYRLDFSLNELEDGKKINTRQYSMHSRSRDWEQIMIGTRVPVESKQGEFQYLDVGTHLRCRLTDQTDTASLGDNVSLSVMAELSSFAMPEQAGHSMQPAIRQIKIEANTVALLGKQMLVGVVDDPNSKRSFQLEVTVTKLR